MFDPNTFPFVSLILIIAGAILGVTAQKNNAQDIDTWERMAIRNRIFACFLIFVAILLRRAWGL